MNKKQTREILTLNADGDLGITYNFLLEDEDEFFSLLSIKILKDGSLVIFNKGNSSSRMWSGELLAARKGERTIKYKDFDEKEVTKSDNVGKTTFHTSGVVNSSSGRVVRDSLRTMDSTQLLSIILHRHPDFMSAILPRENKNNKNISLKVDNMKKSYIQSRVFISSEKHNNIQVYLQDSTFLMVNIRFEGENIEHSDKALYAQVLIEWGPGVVETQKSDKDLMLIPHLNDQLVPEHLKPKK